MKDDRRNSIDKTSGTNFQNLASRVLYSKGYAFFCILIIVINIILLIWQIYLLLLHKRIHFEPIFFSVELFVNLFILFEIILRLLVMKWQYFHFFANIFDMIVFCIGFVTLVLYANYNDDEIIEEADSIILLTITIIRYSVSFARIITLLKSINQNVRVTTGPKIDISAPITETDSLIQDPNNNTIRINNGNPRIVSYEDSDEGDYVEDKNHESED